LTQALPLIARLNWYWICQVLGWTAVAVFNLSLAAGIDVTPAIVGVCFWGAAGGLLLSDLWHRYLKRRGGRMPAVVLAGGIAVLTVLQCAVAYLGFAVLQPFGKPHGFAWLPSALLFWLGCFIAWTIFHTAAQALRRAHRAESEALRLQLQAKEIELRALQAQVNPHFFFNSLNSVRALIYEDREAAARMIDQLAGLMRYALQSGHAETVPLAAELEAVQAYLEIEKIRFEERLRVRIDVEPGLERVMLPPMSLQTLVENAVKYGVEQNTRGSDILIRAWRHGGATRIEIANAGAIGRPGRLGQSTQVGLANARKRLELAVGAGASLELAERDGWVRATLQLPVAA
jgi:signal transduction histidine kinase